MSKLFTLAFLLTISMGSACAQIKARAGEKPQKISRKDKEEKTLPHLSEKGLEAYNELVTAAAFETGYIGYAAVPSTQVLSFKALLEEKNAGAAFDKMLSDGTTAGKLYALSGLYFTDHDRFLVEAGNVKALGAKVQMIDGCEIFDEDVAKIIESDAANVAIIEPGKSMKDFRAGNNGSYFVDIIHGGYPATFKEFADTRTESRK